MMMQFGRKLSGHRGKSTIFGPPARSLSPAEAQASFDQYCSTLWPSGKSAPTLPKVAGSNPDFRNFSAKNWKFSEKTQVRATSPSLAPVSQSRPSTLRPPCRAMKGDNTQLTSEIWKLSGPRLSGNSRSVQTWGSGLTDKPLCKSRGGRGFDSRGRGFFHFPPKSRKKVDFSGWRAQNAPDPRPAHLARYLLGRVQSPRGDSVTLFPGSLFTV